jgi:hypothetical protein
MQRLLRVVALTHFACLISAGVTSAQQLPTTQQVTSTSKLAWDAYPDDNNNVAKFVAELYVKTDIVMSPDGTTWRPRAAAPVALLLDQGRPAIDVTSSSQTGPVFGSALSQGVEYVAFLRAVTTSGDVSELSNGTAPFTLSSVQPNSCTGHNITVSVQDWTRSVPIGNRGRVLWQLANSFPIVQLQIKLGSQVVAQIDGTELRDNAGSYLSLPRTPGTYGFTVFAKDNQGCTAETTAVSRSIVIF